LGADGGRGTGFATPSHISYYQSFSYCGFFTTVAKIYDKKTTLNLTTVCQPNSMKQIEGKLSLIIEFIHLTKLQYFQKTMHLSKVVDSLKTA